MHDVHSCPSEQQLRALALGKLSAEDSDVVFQHISGCNACAARVDMADQADDFVLRQLRELHRSPPTIDQPLKTALDRISSFDSARSTVATAETDDALEPPFVCNAKLRDYEVLHLLGKGGMGAVYKARHVKLDRICALKVLSSSRVQDSQFNRRFEREIRVVGRLDHPNIVRATDAGSHDGRLFLVMEYIDGVDLSTLVHHVGRLSISDACEVVRQTAVALDYTHSHGLVHRDVKPSNIMVDKSGQVSLLDLGLARFEVNDESLQELTGTDQIMGTVDYMAPEQAESSHDVAASSDVYSLGCTLYRLLAGRPPFAAPEFGSTVQKLMAHARRPAESLSALRQDIPSDVSDLVDQMLAKDPVDRPASVRIVAECLSRYSKSDNLSALVADCPKFVGTGLEEQCSPDLLGSLGIVENNPRRTRLAGLMFYVGIPVAALLVFALMSAFFGSGGQTGERADIATLARADGENDPWRVDGERYYPLPENSGEQPEYVPTSFPRLVPDQHTSDGDGNFLSPHVMTRLGSVGLREPASILSLRFLSDGNHIMSATPRAVRVWETATGQEVKTYAIRHGIRAAAVSDDQSVWAALSERLGIVIWDESGHIVNILDRAGHTIEDIDITYDGSILAAGGRDGSITLWSIHSGKTLTKFSAHDVSVSDLVFSADAELLASAGSDGFLRVWQLPSGELASEFPYSDSTITAVCIAPNGQYVVCAMTDGSVHVSSLETGTKANSWTAHESAVLDVAFSTDGTRLVTGGEDHVVRAWKWKTAEPLWTGIGHAGFVGRVAFHPRDELVISSGANEHPRNFERADGTIRLWDAVSGEQVQPGSQQDSHLISIALTSDATRVVGACGARALTIWDGESGESVGNLVGLIPGPKPLAISPDDQLLAVTNGSSVLLRDMATLQGLVKWTPESRGRVLDVSFNTTNTHLALIHASGKIHVYDSATRELVHSWQAHDGNGEINVGVKLIYSPDGRLLASLGRDSTIAVWDSGNFELLYRRPVPANHTQAVTFSPNGWLLASAGYTGRILVHEVLTGEVVRDIKSETGLNCLSFAPDCRTLIAGEFYDRLLCWDVSSGSRYVETIARSSCTITDVELGRSGSILATAGSDGSALLWDLPSLLSKAPELTKTKLSDTKLTKLWSDLKSDDAQLAFAAVWDFVESRETSVPFIESQLPNSFDQHTQRIPTNDAEELHFSRAACALEYAKSLQDNELTRNP